MLELERYSALKRREVGQCHHRGAAVLDDVLECRRRLLEERRRARLADRDHRAGGKRPVDALEVKEIATVVDDGDCSALVVAARLRGRSRRDLLRSFEGQRLFLGNRRRLRGERQRSAQQGERQ
jgi:hypothetical protein